MMTRGFAICAGLLVTAIYFNSTPSSALTQKECSEKYQAAKKAGNAAKWNDFRKAECGSDATAAPAAPTATAPPGTGTEPAAEAKPEKKARKRAAKTETPAADPAAPAATGNAVLPTVVSDKYKTQTPHLQRLHTCSDQWQANKASNGNGGLKWPQFYSQCNTKLKGA